MNRINVRTPAAALGLAGIVSLTACGYGHQVHVAFHQTVPVTGPVTFSLKNTAGTVRIEAAPGPNIDISGYKTGSSLDAANAITIDVKHVGQTVTVSTDYPSGTNGGGATYTIHLPENTAVSVENGAGTIDIDGTTSDVTGVVDAGTIDVTMARLTGSQRVTIKSGTGTAALHVPASSDAMFTTHVGVGSVKTDVPSILGKGTAQVDVSASVGTVTIDRN